MTASYIYIKKRFTFSRVRVNSLSFMCVWRLLFCYSVNIFFPAHDFNFVTIWTGRERWDQYEPSENMALGDAWKQLSWFYYQYLLVTALYMLEPWERTIFSILFP